MLQVDTWRAARTGFPEVIWGPGKSPEQLVAIMTRLAETEAMVVATRITPEVCLLVLHCHSHQYKGDQYDGILPHTDHQCGLHSTPY